ncbi:MAG: fatty acid--CoA ligase family protein, partial [Caulobacterales bacterium]
GAINLKDAPYLRRILVWGNASRPWASPGPETLASAAAASPAIDDALLREIEASISPADDLVVICTSGTTAEPKAVVHTHGSAIRSTFAFAPILGVLPHDKIVNAMPYFWVGGWLRAIMPALFEGAAIVSPPTLNAADIIETVLTERVSFLNFSAGGGIHDFAQEVARRGADLSFVRIGFGPYRDDNGAGEIIPAEEQAASQLGMTETFGTHSGESQHIRQPHGKGGNWGRPMPGIERRIVDIETGEILGANQQGELQVRGHTLMRGYLKREYSDVFTPDGFFATGDRCSIDEDDYLYFQGRVKELIKSAGANVSPREVEAVLASYPEIREAMVFGVPDKRKGQGVAAIVVPVDIEGFDADAIRTRIKSEISSYKVPSVIIPMANADIPRTGSGKPKKNELLEIYLALQNASVA